jgi:GNAT superfamily N-acetyltransferase
MILVRNDEVQNYIFSFNIMNEEEYIGQIIIVPHPKDPKGGMIHIEIVEKWRCRWLGKRFVDQIYYAITDTARSYGLNILYSTAIHKNSPRLLEFFGFQEYYKKQPKKYYYMNLRGNSWEYQH